jgi:dihydroorotate dehydrogenase (fumarate)
MLEPELELEFSQAPVLSPLMNASGCNCKTRAQLDALVAAGMKTIITKTCTLEPNKGNPNPVFLEVGYNVSVNCLGMPNLGYFYYRDLYKEYKSRGITYIISMDASNLDQLLVMLLNYDSFLNNLCATEYVEINLSCPSTNCSRIIAYDILTLARVLEAIKLLNLTNIKIGLKLAPYIDKIILQNVANIISKYQADSRINYIVCANSIPNGMVIDTQSGLPVLSAKTGGISGMVNKLISLANVYQFNEMFIKLRKRDKIKIIGCGGIETPHDISEYKAAGADSVQIGRLLYTHGTDILHSLINPNSTTKINTNTTTTIHNTASTNLKSKL